MKVDVRKLRKKIEREIILPIRKWQRYLLSEKDRKELRNWTDEFNREKLKNRKNLEKYIARC